MSAEVDVELEAARNALEDAYMRADEARLWVFACEEAVDALMDRRAEIAAGEAAS